MKRLPIFVLTALSIALLGNAIWSPRPALAQNTGPVAHYTFDDGTGRDVSGNGHDAQITNATPRAGCMDFNGKDSYLVAPDGAGLPTGNGARTVAYWFNYNGATPSVIVSLGNSTGVQRFLVGLTGDGTTNYVFTDAINGSNNIALTSAVPAPGTWNHLAFTYDGAGQWKLFLNGVFKQAGTFPVGINTVTNAVDIGFYRGNGWYSLGTLDDVRIYNRAITSQEIAAIAAVQPTCPSAPAVCYAAQTYQYHLAVYPNAYIDGGGNVSGNAVSCPGLPGGWSLIDQRCLISGGPCWSIACLYSQPSSQAYSYVMNGAGAPPGQSNSCRGMVPGPGYNLQMANCSSYSTNGGCANEVCWWSKPATDGGVTDLALRHQGAASPGGYINGCQTEVPSGYSLINRTFLLTYGSDNHPSSDLCVIGHTINSCPVRQCSDGLDNDADGKIDAQDPGCHTDGNVNNTGSYDPNDNDETNAIVTVPQCRDGIDNDGDELIDFPADPGCSNPDDNDETNVTPITCYANADCGTNGFVGGPFCSGNTVTRNYISYTCLNPGTAQSSCTSSTTPQTQQMCSANQTCSGGTCVSNQLPQCSDGIDNDHDGRIDFFDSGCYPNNVFNPALYNPNDNDESNPAVLCRWARVNNTWVRNCR